MITCDRRGSFLSFGRLFLYRFVNINDNNEWLQCALAVGRFENRWKYLERGYSKMGICVIPARIIRVAGKYKTRLFLELAIVKVGIFELDNNEK